jgi:tripartite-type tricarboxylate transporter receptor subunit TctC
MFLELRIAHYAWILAAFTTASAALATAAFAQKYPDRPIRIVVPLPPGGSVDIVARLLQPLLEKSLGQSIVVDNRSGASGIIGANAVATALPDGYTLLLAPTTFSITAALHPKLPFDPLRAFQPIMVVGSSAQLVLINPKIAANSLQEFVALAKTSPNTMNYATPGASSQAHLLFELWSSQAGIKMQHVPYRGGAPALMATVAGETQITLISSSVALPQIEAKALRPLATGGTAREPQLPNVPTTAEAGFPNFKAVQWIGLFATGGTPKEIVDRLNANVNRTLEDRTLQARFAEQGLSTAGGSPEEFRALIESEIRQWTDVARVAKIEMN